MTYAARQPAGSPTGGQFAPSSKPAPPASLTLVQDSDQEYVERPDNEVELDYLPLRLKQAIWSQVPDAAEVWFEVDLEELVPEGNPMAAYDAPGLSPDGAVIVDSEGVKHPFQIPESGSIDYYKWLSDLGEASDSAREDGPAMREGDTATYEL